MVCRSNNKKEKFGWVFSTCQYSRGVLSVPSSASHIYTLIWPNNFLSLTGYWLETISTKLAYSYSLRATNFWISDIISSGLTRDPFTVRPIDAALIRLRDYTSRYNNFGPKGDTARETKQFDRAKSTVHLISINYFKCNFF
ncbi:hypothetical protein PUN28_017112 [Cardiocondyla obscurior]|uniref:Uncharacterized protein n=1 Tax=Cardiocondyla obscurior TaxID=286306 RepID=A0AAW2EPB4_9HYME